MTYDFVYKDLFEDFLKCANEVKSSDGGALACTWLYDFDNSKLQEAERLNVILPLLKWCAEHDMMTEVLRDELYLYYEDYVNGKLTPILAEYEAADVIRDLTTSFFKVFPEGLDS